LLQQVGRNFAGLSAIDADSPTFSIGCAPENGDESWLLTDDNGTQKIVDAIDLLYEIEGIVVKAAQLALPELVFLHAAALEYNSHGFLLVGDSGAGKSTLCWALAKSGSSYLSDELAPLSIELDRIEVAAYPHAICLKEEPADPFGFPDEVFDTGLTWHIPIDAFQDAQCTQAAKVQSVFFVRNQPNQPPNCRPMSRAEAAHKMYPQLLNALAHPSKGLSVVTELSSRLATYEIVSGELSATVELLTKTLERENNGD